MESPARLPVRWRRPRLDDRRLPRLWPDDVEQGQEWQYAHPVACLDRGHDGGSSDPGAEGGIGPRAEFFRQPRLGLWRVDRHAAHGFGGFDRDIWLVWRLGHDLVDGPPRRIGRCPLTQRAWTSPVPPDVCRDFCTLAYQAIDD